MTTKITDHHLSREACIYLRQSGQVRFNRESTERQYQLSSRARELGPERRPDAGDTAGRRHGRDGLLNHPIAATTTSTRSGVRHQRL